jgi:hypothetical protein
MTTIKTEILKDVLRIHLVIQLVLLYHANWILSLSVILGGLISSLNFYFMASQCEQMLQVDSAKERSRLAALSAFVRYGVMAAVVLLISSTGFIAFEGFLPSLLSVQLAVFLRGIMGRHLVKADVNREHF